MIVGFVLVVGILVFGKLYFSRIIPTPTPIATINPFPYKIPSVQNKRSYLTVLVGDSMTDALGVNANQLRLDLISYYPTHEFVNYNYGFGSTNILSILDRLNTGSTYLGKTYPPILTQGFDLTIIESFAYNPLSQFPPEHIPSAPGRWCKNASTSFRQNRTTPP